MGIKLIPLGAHFITYSLKDEAYSFKQGFFIFVGEKSKVHIRKWDKELMDFISLDEDENKNFEIGVNNLEFDQHLGNYPIEQISNWKDLSVFIDQDILSRLEPVNRKYITTSKEYDGVGELNIKGNIFFTQIPKKNLIVDSDPNKLTRYNIDKSAILEDLITKEYNNCAERLLGEFQYSFITFFLGEVYESFEQWKSIFLLLCSCCESIKCREKLFCEFIETIYHQLRQLPKDFFHDELSTNNFIGKGIENMLYSSYEAPESIKRRMSLLHKFMKEFFNFEIKDEDTKILDRYIGLNNDDDEDMPVIVSEREIASLMNHPEYEPDNTDNTENTMSIYTDDVDLA